MLDTSYLEAIKGEIERIRQAFTKEAKKRQLKLSTGKLNGGGLFFMAKARALQLGHDQPFAGQHLTKIDDAILFWFGDETDWSHDFKKFYYGFRFRARARFRANEDLGVPMPDIEPQSPPPATKSKFGGIYLVLPARVIKLFEEMGVQNPTPEKIAELVNIESHSIERKCKTTDKDGEPVNFDISPEQVAFAFTFPKRAYGRTHQANLSLLHNSILKFVNRKRREVLGRGAKPLTVNQLYGPEARRHVRDNEKIGAGIYLNTFLPMIDTLYIRTIEQLNAICDLGKDNSNISAIFLDILRSYNRQTYSKTEKFVPSPILQKLADGLGCTPEDIVSHESFVRAFEQAQRLKADSKPPAASAHGAADIETLFRATAIELVKAYTNLGESMEMTYLRRMHGIHNVKRTGDAIMNIGPEHIDILRKDFDHEKDEAETFLQKAEKPLLAIVKTAGSEITMTQIAAALDVYARDPERSALSRHLAGVSDEEIGNLSRPAKSADTIAAVRDRILKDMVAALRS